MLRVLRTPAWKIGLNLFSIFEIKYYEIELLKLGKGHSANTEQPLQGKGILSKTTLNIHTYQKIMFRTELLFSVSRSCSLLTTTRTTTPLIPFHFQFLAEKSLLHHSSHWSIAASESYYQSNRLILEYKLLTEP